MLAYLTVLIKCLNNNVENFKDVLKYYLIQTFLKCCLLFSPVVILKKLQDIIRPRYTKNHANKSFCDIDGCPNGRFYFLNAFSSFYVKFLIHLNTIIWYHFHFLLYIFLKYVMSVSPVISSKSMNHPNILYKNNIYL